MKPDRVVSINVKPPEPGELSPMQEEIISAALRCFERLGVQQTSMEEIADEANIVRKTIYRAFTDRDTMLSVILQRRLLMLSKSMRAHLASYQTLQDALVDGYMGTLKILRRDKLLFALYRKTTSERVGDLLLMGNAGSKELIAYNWGHLLERARQSGELQSPLPDKRLLEWIRQFGGLLLLREDLNEAAQRTLLADFLVPSILGIVAPGTDGDD